MTSANPKLINDLRAFRTRQRAARTATNQTQARDFQRRAKKLFSKADFKTAGKIVGDLRAERNRANLEIGGSAEAKDAHDVEVGKKLNRQLGRALPGFREFQSLKKAHLSAHHKAAVAAFGGPSSDRDHVRWGDLVATDNLDAEEFSAPFQVFDVDTNDPAQLIKRDQSFVSHSQGTMMNAFHFEHHESPALILEVFDFSRATPASGLVACGINYTMPRTGRLRVNAVMQNFYSEVLYSIRDHFGFSHASLEIEINLFVAFASGGSIIYSPTTILWTSRNSNGGNVSGSLSGFDSTAPYTVSADSEATLQAGQGIQIFAGSEVHIESEVDDMTTKVDAVVRFQLMKLAVSVI